MKVSRNELRLREVQAELQLEKQKLLEMGQSGLSKAKNSIDVLEEFRERPLEATLLALCGVLVAAKVFKPTQKT
jgi:hypothetical protein